MATVKVLIADHFENEGIRILEQAGLFEVDAHPPMEETQLVEIVGAYDALIVRSSTQVTRRVLEAASQLRVIARAGIGLDNIDLEAATRQGIVVVNSPEGNVTSAAEHTIALLLACARNVVRGDASLRQGQWLRKDLTGVELSGRTLGILGLGHIGREVARLAQAFGMQVLAHDPFLSKDVAQSQGVQLTERDALLETSDVVSLHLPLTASTTRCIGAAELRKMKKGAIVVNCARGGVIDEAALCEALRAGRLSGAALDVFEQEPPGRTPLADFPNVVLTPHLGGNTQEAQRRVSTDVAHQIVSYFRDGQLPGAVNMVRVKEPWMAPYLDLARTLGLLAAQLSPGRLLRVSVSVQGTLAGQDCRPLSVAALSGALSRACGTAVNLVNAELLARERGVRVTESKSREAKHYVNLVSVTLETEKAVRAASGALLDGRVARLTRLDDYAIDIPPAREMLILFHPDRPGMIGRLGTILGEHSINIDQMSTSRKARGQQALTILTLDDPIPGTVLDRLREAIPSSQIDPVQL